MDLLADHLCVYASLCLPSFLHVSVSLWRAVLHRCFVFIHWQEQTALQFILMMIDDVFWIMTRHKHEAWQGPSTEAPTEPELSLPWLPWLRAGSKVRQPTRGCEKPCLIPSSGSYWGFHTSPLGTRASIAMTTEHSQPCDPMGGWASPPFTCSALFQISRWKYIRLFFICIRGGRRISELSLS